VADPFPTRLAVAVRTRRADLRLSQQDVADMAGVSERFVRFVEQGKPTLRLDTLLSLLDTLGLELQLATRSSAAARALVTEPQTFFPPSASQPEGDGPSERKTWP